MAPKRRLFQPPEAPPPQRDEVMSLGFEPPAPKPKAVALEDDIRLVTNEPDDDLATAKMIRLLRDRGQELRDTWGEESFQSVADTFRKRVSAAQLQKGQPAPDARNMMTGTDEPGAVERDFEGLLGNVAEIPTMPAQAWEHFGVQPIPADQLGYHNRGEAMARTAIAGLGQVATALPDIGVGLGTMAGTGIAAMTGGAPSGPSLGQQGASALAPVAALGEYATSAPAIATDLMGGNPASLPGILARSEEYINNLYARAAERPAEPAFGALMVGGLGHGAIAAKRRLFDPRPAAPAAPIVQPPPVETVAPTLPMEDVVNPAPYSTRRPVPLADQTQVMPSQPIAERLPQRPAPDPAAPAPRTMRDAMSARRDPNVISAADLDRPPPESFAPGDDVVNPPPNSAQPGPAIADQTDVMPSRPIADKLPDRPSLGARDVDAMIQGAKQKPAAPPAPAPKRRLMTRPTGRGSRSRGGGLTIPSLDQIRDNVRQIGRDVAGAATRYVQRNTPRPAPPAGSPGGPGTGRPFVVEALRPALKVAQAPLTALGAMFDNVAHPSAWGSFFERTGINALATQADRIGNTFDLDSTKFIFGDEPGKVWLREQFQKAGRDLWSAVRSTREGAALTPAETAAVRKHRAIFDQLTGPAFKFLDHVRGQNIYRDLGENYWPHDWGTLADVNGLLGDERPGWTPGKGVGPDIARSHADAPLRNPVDVIDGYRASLRDKLTRRQMLQAFEEFAPKLDERGQMMLSEYVNGALFKQASGIDKWARDFLIGDALKNHPKPGESFDLDGAFELEGDLRVTGEGYTSPTRGQTYKVEIDGRPWPVAFSGPELAALKLGESFPSPKPVSAVVGAVNKGASYYSIAGNIRTLWRQLTGGQSRFIAEAEVGDYSYGHKRAGEYFAGKLPEADIRMLQESGILDGETTVQGLDLARSEIDKGLFSNVYIPDTQTKIAAWFAEWNKIGRENPGMPREARMDAATAFALRVSDLNLSMVQAPWGNTPTAALFGLFNKSRLRELRHVANMTTGQKARYAGTTGAAMGGLALLGALNKEEMKSILWSVLPFGESLGEVVQKSGLPGGAASRHGGVFGAAGADIAASYAPEVLGVAVKTISDIASGRMGKYSMSDAADEADSRARRIFPLRAAYRTASDLTRATLGSGESRRAARASIVTAPQPPYQTEYQKDRSQERAAESRSSGNHSSGGRRGKKRRLFGR